MVPAEIEELLPDLLLASKSKRSGVLGLKGLIFWLGFLDFIGLCLWSMFVGSVGFFFLSCVSFVKVFFCGCDILFSIML